MKYTYDFEEYKNLLIENNELDAISFSKDDSYEYIISKLEERSFKKRDIYEKANTIIHEYIEVFEKNPDLLNAENVKALEKFSNMLFPDKAATRNINVSDFSMFYRIEKVLVNYYKKINDINKYAFSVNRRSLGHILVVNGHSYRIQDSPFKQDTFDLAKELDSGKLDDVARTKVLVSMGREGLSSEIHFPVDQYQYIYDVLIANFPKEPSDYDVKNLVFFCNIVMQVFREHNIWAKDYGFKVDVEASRPLLKKIENTFSDLIKKYPSFDGRDVVVNFKITDYFLGDISIDECLETISDIQYQALQDPSPLMQAQGLGTFNNYYLNILYKFSDKPKEEIKRLSQERIHEVMPKLMNVTRQVNNVLFNRYIVEFLNAASLTGTFKEYAEIILECTVYADKALFIHTAMVKEMSLIIFDYLIDNNIEVFDGVSGKDLEYIKAHKEEMRKLLSDCCMFHDIGKFFMLDLVENSMRKLTDDEFEIIKEHPSHFENIFQVIDDTDEKLLCIRDCALTHHLWHDGTKGYPNIAQTKNRPFADILAVADSIDAATDFFGRPYNSGKNIDELIKEFQSQSGTKYGKEVVDILSVPFVRDKLKYWITEGRKDIYYRIYAFNKL